MRVVGEPVRDRAVLFVSNHVSWVDILVIGSVAPVAFVAKSEVANWPLVGITARLQRTVFVDRTRRQQTGDAIAEIVKRLAGGTSVVLFAEGTSSDGNRVLPFRSALVGAVQRSRLAASAAASSFSRCRSATPACTASRWAASTARWSPGMAISTSCRTSRRLIARGAVDAVVSYRRTGRGRQRRPTARRWRKRWKATVRGARPPRRLRGRARARCGHVLKSVMKSTTMDHWDKARSDRLDWSHGFAIRAAIEQQAQPRKVHVKSFGCQMNVYDSHRMADTLGAGGLQRDRRSRRDADLVILNTCHIREKAADKVYSEIGRIREMKEDAARHRAAGC